MTVAAGLEAVTFDGLELNDDTNLGLASFDCPPPRQRAEWVGSADSEFQTLFRDPLYENRELTCRVQVVPQSTTDAALDKLNQIRDKLAEASKREDGLALTWRPADSNRTVTFDVLAGEITDMPIDWEGGWLVKAPSVTIRMSAKPAYRMTEFATVTDAFGTNSIADYTFDAGAAGNVSITGGVMDAAANLTTENRLYHSTSPYPVTDSQVTIKHTLGTTLTSYKAGVILKRTSVNDYLIVYVDDTGAASRLRIDRVIGGATTNLVSTALTRMTVSTAYWVRARLEGNIVVGEHWTAAPTATGTAATANTATLAGADATAFGVGVSGWAGLVWTPQQTAASLDDLEIAPHVAVSGSAPVTTMAIPDVAGDLGGKVKLTITNRSSADPIRHFEWGGEQRYYSASSPVSLVIDSDSLVTSGFAGSQTTQTGAYDPDASGNNVIRATLAAAATAVCGTGSLTHVGKFRPAARMYASSDKVRVRLSWRSGDGGYLSLPWKAPIVTGAFCDVQFGTIDPQTASMGTQAWDGRIEAYSTDGSNPTIDIDFLDMMPASEGYGVSHAQTPGVAGVVVGRDDFTGTTAGNALNTRSAPAGGTWATSGDATDYLFSDTETEPAGIGLGTGEALKRTAVSGTNGRYAVLGSSNYTDVEIECELVSDLGPATNQFDMGVIARWTDSSNYLRASFIRSGPTNVIKRLEIRQIVAGVATQLASVENWPAGVGSSGKVWKLRLTVDAAGRAAAQVLSMGSSGAPAEGTVMLETSATTSVLASRRSLATGGTLATGKPGIFDLNTSSTAITRIYDDFVVFTPPAELPAIYAGRRLEIGTDRTLREGSAGGTWGNEQSYRGARPLIPAAGTADRTTRLAFKGHKNDLSSAAYDPVIASYSVQATITPRGLVVPRG